MEARFETAFLKAVKKHAAIKKLVQKKVDMILADPIAMGEPLKGNWQGFYSCPVKRNFIIIYLFCDVCRKKGDDAVEVSVLFVLFCENIYDFWVSIYFQQSFWIDLDQRDTKE